MAPSLTYSLADVLAVAKIHPFYSDTLYPPDQDAIHAAREEAALNYKDADFQSQKLLRKKDLYTAIERLLADTSSQNAYRHNVYTSITGGGSNSKPLLFATDALENRRHRGLFGQFLWDIGVITRGDWVVTTHTGGELYRSLDLALEILENAGASVLAAGSNMPPAKVVGLLQDFHANVLSGDGSQVLQIVHSISTLPASERKKVRLDKVIYTSEGLTTAQKAHIHAVLGPVKICSILGSAEAGPYGASSPDITPGETMQNHTDFVIDVRMSLIEILPLSLSETDSLADVLPEGETGMITQTCLTRLRNPVVRYVTGDIGSLHPLPEKARDVIPEARWPYLRILRLHGRDRRFSFEWDGAYYDFSKLSAVVGEPDLGVLQWQVILDKMQPSQEASLEVRLLQSIQDGSRLSLQAVNDCLEDFFHVDPSNQHRFRITHVKGLNEFDLSETGRKVIRFVDRFH